jgi:NADH:ubiquinone oxidoreductase subunit 3 (subunit A)
MLYDYISFAFFTLVAVLVPVSLIVFSKIVRSRKSPNKVKGAPYESGEESVGTYRSAEIEYLPFAMLFLPFEIIAIIVLLWASGARQDTLLANLAVLGLAAMASAFALVCYKIVSEKNE